MHTVTINTEGKYSIYEEFENEFLKICQSHREADRALVFAFILYDFENAQISKVIEDPNYWLSLNAISGNYLTVFSLHYKPEELKQQMISEMKNKMNFGTNKKSGIISATQNPSKDTNKLIRKYFGDNIEIIYPSVLFFQIKNNSISDYRLIQLQEKQLEASFLELRNYIDVAAKSLYKVNRENKNNVDELFTLVDSSVQGTRKGIKIKKGIKRFASIVELTSAIMGFKS